MLVHEYFDKTKICVDIKTDDSTFYFKFLDFTRQSIDAEGKPVNYMITYYKSRHFWRNRNSMNSSKEMINGQRKWDIVLHRRISDYFKIYTTILNFANFILVAHPNMISVYNMNNSAWEENIASFSDPIKVISVKKAG